MLTFGARSDDAWRRGVNDEPFVDDCVIAAPELRFLALIVFGATIDRLRVAQLAQFDLQRDDAFVVAAACVEIVALFRISGEVKQLGAGADVVNQLFASSA